MRAAPVTAEAGAAVTSHRLALVLLVCILVVWLWR